jgi:hypothetical protein
MRGRPEHAHVFGPPGDLRDRRTGGDPHPDGERGHKFPTTQLERVAQKAFLAFPHVRLARLTDLNPVSAGQLWLLCEFFEVPIASMFEGVNKKMFKLATKR